MEYQYISRWTVFQDHTCSHSCRREKVLLQAFILSNNLIVHFNLNAYRDQIGNISSSSIKKRTSDNFVSLDMRFPLFGGWRTEFYAGYSISQTSIMAIKNYTEDGMIQECTLSIPYNTMFKKAWVDNLETKIILPTGAWNISVNYPHQRYTRELPRTNRLINAEIAPYFLSIPV